MDRGEKLEGVHVVDVVRRLIESLEEMERAIEEMRAKVVRLLEPLHRIEAKLREQQEKGA